jgi:geranylgeranyl diphosphate synthase type I
MDLLATKRQSLPEAEPLLDELARLLGAGGKRLRPSFCYWGYRAAGSNHDDSIVRAAASLELLHSFAIIHDDIMDGSPARRGQPSTHVVHGLSFAVLAGDLALVLADDLFMSVVLEHSARLRAWEAYSRMRQEVIAGQLLDVQLSDRAVVSEEEVRRVAVLKSGRYSIEEPLVIGASLAGAQREFFDSLCRFGAPLGEAFQLRDDLLGSFGDSRSTGKPVDSDIREGKRNLLFARTANALSAADRDFFLSNWGKGSSLDPMDVERLRALIGSSGARASTEETLVDLASRALMALQSLDIPDDARFALEELCRLSTERDI